MPGPSLFAFAEEGRTMFIKIDTKSDRRLVRAVKDLLAAEFTAGHVMASVTVIYIEHENPLGLLESYLDRLRPQWRSNTSAHTHLQGAYFTKELMLLRVWNMCRDQNKDLVAQPVQLVDVAPVRPEPKRVEQPTLATLYQVPAVWLAVVPLETRQVYYPADVSEPTEGHVRRPQRVLRDPVRCGRCSDQVEYGKRGSHASYHGVHVNDIEWTPVTRFRRE
jgi:hypothetical protein